MFTLYLITKPHQNLLEIVVQATQSGVTMVQFRDKNINDRQMIAQAKLLRQHIPKDIPLIINDRLSVAYEVGDGIHVGIDDVCPIEARKKLGPEAVIGLTIHDRIDLAERYRDVIDYVGVGPIFKTSTKPDAKKILGVARLQEIVQHCPVPVVAIGGISLDTVTSVGKTGVSGISVCSAIIDSIDPALSATRLLKSI
jgi:thiamine-phosphate pyrophosphorylase